MKRFAIVLSLLLLLNCSAVVAIPSVARWRQKHHTTVLKAANEVLQVPRGGENRLDWLKPYSILTVTQLILEREIAFTDLLKPLGLPNTPINNHLVRNIIESLLGLLFIPLFRHWPSSLAIDVAYFPIAFLATYDFLTFNAKESKKVSLVQAIEGEHTLDIVAKMILATSFVFDVGKLFVLVFVLAHTLVVGFSSLWVSNPAAQRLVLFLAAPTELQDSRILVPFFFAVPAALFGMANIIGLVVANREQRPRKCSI